MFRNMKLVKDTDKIKSNKAIVTDKQAEEAFRTILSWIGEDPNREGLIETPKRVAKAFKEYFKGYSQDANKELLKTFGDVEGYDDMVVEKKYYTGKSLRTSHGTNYRCCSCCVYSKQEGCWS